ncbi:HAD-superfamily hydrolase subfamily IIB [hydrothermal vent metagenome]|uniref:HAD-superfamily hydrolase subfamily IIB n=1 Tax=hydrothermal vent metagenome TaxID=652676 RepID=A0A3B0ZC16_9ZZZZ
MIIPARRLLLCTDMDRTLIPNGSAVESRFARQRFTDFITVPEVTLVYVTGRDRQRVTQAMADYDLPLPDYAITDVGTRIYKIKNREWQELQDWTQQIGNDWQGKSVMDIQNFLTDIGGLRLQESEKQNKHKLSYYVDLTHDKLKILEAVNVLLRQSGIAANIIWSIDDEMNLGLLDILPKSANKLHAVTFLQRQLHYKPGETLFAGDSGNDLDVMGSIIPSVLVANASDEIREVARKLAYDAGNSASLYCANGQYVGMNGNYAAGILEGVWHFYAEYRDSL